jgi:RNA polymerase sigma-B factor
VVRARPARPAGARAEGRQGRRRAREGPAPPADRPEIGAKVGATEEQVLEALEAAGAYRATSFDAPRGSAGEDEGDSLADATGTTEEGFDLAEQRATIERLMASVTPREREVLRLRFVEDLTQAEIGARIGVSQMQVSRLIRQSLARLRTAALTAERADGG